MNRQTHELLLDHVRAIYQAVTGAELRPTPSGAPLPAGPQATELVLARFAELEACVRALPALSARVPPFGFAPAADVFERKTELTIELAVPGASQDAVEARVMSDVLVVSGIRDVGGSVDGRIYRHAEIPRGPFRRAVPLPPDVAAEPIRLEVQDGIVRVHLHKVGAGAVAEA